LERREVLIDELVLIRKRILRNEIAAADFGPIDIERLRGKVEQPLDHKHAMLAAGTAIGRDDRQVGED
jgi:hypothetical protein